MVFTEKAPLNRVRAAPARRLSGIRSGHELKHIDFETPVAEFVYQHHERIDGSGYPLGLKGDEIHLESQIIAAADIYESMSNNRPYRVSPGKEKALRVVAESGGQHFSEEISKALLHLADEKAIEELA